MAFRPDIDEWSLSGVSGPLVARARQTAMVARLETAARPFGVPNADSRAKTLSLRDRVIPIPKRRNRPRGSV